MSKDIVETIVKRRSIHKFHDIPVPKDIIGEMLISGQYSQCAGNFQNCRVIVIDDESTKDLIADACFRQTWMKSAPVFFVVVANPKDLSIMYGDRGSKLYSIQNASIIAQNMILTASDRGLGTCWVSAFNEEKIQQALGLPDEFIPQVVIPLGYIDEVVPVPPKIALIGFVFINTYGGLGRFDSHDLLFKEYANYMQKNVVKVVKNTNAGVTAVSKLAIKKIKPHLRKIHGHIKNKFFKKDKSLKN